MLMRFCKLYYQKFDRNIIIIRRFSAKYSNDEKISEYLSDEETDNQNFELNEQSKNIENIPEPKKNCIIKCKNPKFNFYEDQVYPKFEAMPLASRGWHHRKSKGDYFTIYPQKNMVSYVNEDLTFDDIDIDKTLIDNLKSMNLNHPTSIQELGIPKILDGENVILTAETGCGKTLAFLLPLLHQILHWKPLHDRGFNRPLAIILTPSQELTLQISRVAKRLAKNLDVNIVTLTGGKTKQIIHNPPVSEVDLIVATVGVMKSLIYTDIYKLNQIKHVILDEADTLLDETFYPAVNKVLKKIKFGAGDNTLDYPSTAQLTLNSASIPQELSDKLFGIVDTDSLKLVTTGFEHQVQVPQKFLRLTGPGKSQELLKVVKSKIKSKTPIIVFCNTTSACNFVAFFLKEFNIECEKLHKNLTKEARRIKFRNFMNGVSNVLVTTDAGARGLDTIIAKEVINFDFPLITSEYLHRCGRTGRIGSPKDCRVINFISRPLEIILVSKIEFAIRKNKPIPLVDMIHGNDKEGEFIRSDSVDEERDEDDEGENDEELESDSEENISGPADVPVKRKGRSF